MTEKSGVGSDGRTGLAFTSAGASFMFAWDIATDIANIESDTVYVRIKANDGILDGNLATSSAFSADTKAPTISNVTSSQPTGSGSVTISYDLADNTGTGLSVTLDVSDDGGTTWTVAHPSTTGSVGSNQTTGTGKSITWNADADFDGQYQTDMRIRLRPTDSFVNIGAYTQSSNFTLDTANPTISNVTASQNSGSDTVTITYDLADDSTTGLTTNIDISDDGGLTWTVPTTTLTGNVGSGQTTGTGKTVTWNAGTDFTGNEQNDLQVRVRGVDNFANIGSFASSSNFLVDTKEPVVTSLTASQITGTRDVVVRYTLADDTFAGHAVDIEISEDGGATWTVPTTSASGDVGFGQGVGTGKVVTWNAGADFNGHATDNLRVRIRGRDVYGNQGIYTQSENLSLDTLPPILSSLSGAQELGTKLVNIHYAIHDDSGPLSVSMEVSSDGGTSWTVLAPTATGGIGSAIQSGANKVIVWNAGVDFDNQEKSNMRVRLVGIDRFGNGSVPFASTDFILDTAPPAGLSSFSQSITTASSIAFTWAPGVSDAHFYRYELWYGTEQGDVEERTGGARRWSVEYDPALALSATNSTVLASGLQQGVNYFAELFAFDDNGSGSTVAGLHVNLQSPQSPQSSGGGFVLPAPLPTSTVTPSGVPQSSDTVPSVKTSASPGERPTLTAVGTPIRSTDVALSGLASPGSTVELYDSGTFVARFSKPTNSQGEFQQVVTFTEGGHALTVKALDSGGASSDASPVVLFVVDTIAPSAPAITNPRTDGTVSASAVTLNGTSEPLSTLEITLDGKNKFSTTVNALGNWSFVLPDAFALAIGDHAFSVSAHDEAGNSSAVSRRALTRVFLPVTTPSTIIPLFVAPATTPRTITTIPVLRPAAEIIREVSKAVEIPTLSPPQVVSASTATAGTFTNDIINFAGTALPNEDIVIYIHSEQAVVYRTKADSEGKWSFDHSQNVLELAPGTHTIYAVGLDPVANVKTRPSLVKTFTVEKNWWAVIYGYLNLYSTVFSLAVISLILLWLYRRERLSRQSPG